MHYLSVKSFGSLPGGRKAQLYTLYGTAGLFGCDGF